MGVCKSEENKKMIRLLMRKVRWRVISNVLLFGLMLVVVLGVMRVTKVEFYSSGGMELSVFYSILLAVPFFFAITFLKPKFNLTVFRFVFIPVITFLFYFACESGNMSSIHSRFILIAGVFFTTVVVIELLPNKFNGM